MGNDQRCDSAISAVNSDASETRFESDEIEDFRSDRQPGKDASLKRPLRLSNAHRRRVSEASINGKSTNSGPVKSGKPTDASSSNTSTVVADFDVSFDFSPTEYGSATTPLFSPTEVNCICCGIPHPPLSHDDQFPEKCWEHQACLARGGWKKHLERVPHTRCPLSDCVKAGADFKTQEKFLQHWFKRHDEKCWYWGKKKGFFGSETAVWLQWKGR
ncbi:uncharacterized protein LY89DRAFT_732597 [Mollisia scopiformis]|uniref:Uncharacterized protein n=1 Tax=Mollisia scopiformis TaxID=149040 RepID=A0A194XCI6_MOLSC|nr:uncharacterized protein LY89DRAFT_732597 [Mollisia scopiformis]KUJ17888.1 hypothetical protein LY89DRAFT_732597 [Mollisia scopiformis]